MRNSVSYGAKPREAQFDGQKPPVGTSRSRYVAATRRPSNVTAQGVQALRYFAWYAMCSSMKDAMKKYEWS